MHKASKYALMLVIRLVISWLFGKKYKIYLWFLAVNQISPLAAKTKEFFIWSGSFVFWLTLNLYFCNNPVKPTLDCIIPNRIPVNNKINIVYYHCDGLYLCRFWALRQMVYGCSCSWYFYFDRWNALDQTGQGWDSSLDHSGLLGLEW